jgi:hypothetical protein
MSNKNLFKEAIADAKAVREAALANAKAALEEALTPKLHSMLAEKMKEMGDMEEDYSYEDGEMEEGFVSPHDKDHSQTDFFMPEGEEELEEEFDISEILAELDEDYSLEEAKKEDEMKMKMKMKKKKMNEADDEEESEEESVADMTIDDLKALIADIVAQEMGGEEGDEMEAGEEEIEMDMDSEEEDEESIPLDEEEINLEELLAELDAMGSNEDLEEIDVMGGIKKGLKKVGQAVTGASTRAKYVVGATPEDTKGALGLNLSAEEVFDIVKANYEKRTGKTGEPSNYYKSLRPSSGGGLGTSGFGYKEGKNVKEEMNEAIRTINTLRNELNEVNLLNAKLLYVNKIFKAKNLSESQKLKVIASFDKATTAKEAKVVFESLNSTLTTSAPKQAIKESLGFASRAVGVAPRKAIVESNDVITRMQKLANIIK